MLQRLIRAPFDPRIPGWHPRVLPQWHGYSLEVLALRQQVAVLKRKRPRPSLNPSTASSLAVIGMISALLLAVSLP